MTLFLYYNVYLVATWGDRATFKALNESSDHKLMHDEKFYDMLYPLAIK